MPDGPAGALGHFPVVGFIPTSDAVRAREFYETALGLKFLSDDPFAIVFQSGKTGRETLIRLVKIQSFSPVPYTILGWEVTGITSIVGRLGELGIVFERYPWAKQDELGIWTTPNGDKVAWFKDPDGNLLSVSEQSPQTA